MLHQSEIDNAKKYSTSAGGWGGRGMIRGQQKLMAVHLMNEPVTV